MSFRIAARLGFALILLTIPWIAAHPVLAVETVREHLDEQLGGQVARFVDLINEGDSSKLQRFVRERYGESMMADMTVEGHAQFLKDVHDARSPIELCCFRVSDLIPEGMAIAVLYGSRNDTWSELQLRFDDTAKVISLMIISTKPPLEFVDLEKLDDEGLARELDAFLSGMAAQDEFAGTALLARDGRQLFAGATSSRSSSKRISSSRTSRITGRSSPPRRWASNRALAGPTATLDSCWRV